MPTPTYPYDYAVTVVVLHKSFVHYDLNPINPIKDRNEHWEITGKPFLASGLA